MTRVISKSMLRLKMFEVFRQVETSGEEIIVTGRGRPALKIIPIKQKKSTEELFGDIKERVIYLVDINEPTMDEWEDT